MIEEVFHLGSYSQSPFGLFMMLAFAAAFLQLRSNLLRLGIGTTEDAHSLILWAMFSGFAGGKIYFAILNGDWRALLERAGFVWYGGFTLASIVLMWILRRRRLPLARSVDAAAPALALGYAVGRIGCFLVGDDYGVPTDAPWGVKFPVGVPPTHAGALREEFGLAIPAEIPAQELLSVHPTQLYETVLGVLIWVVGMMALRRFRRPGAAGILVIGLLAVERFAVEFLRAKDDRVLGQFTLAQAISIAVVATVVIVAVRMRTMNPSESLTSP